MNKKRKVLYKYISDIKSFKWEMATKSLLAGAVAGLLAVIYRIATEKGTVIAALLYGYLKAHPLFIPIWAVCAVAAGLFIAWLIKLEPMASGGGVSQVEGVVLYGLKMKWLAVIVVRYVAGTLGSVFGLSFGPEGPSVQLGAAVNQGLSKKICKTREGGRYLVTAGAAAGLSTAFGAPLTGMIFALEEIHRSFSPTILLSATTASLTADFIAKYFFGLKPIIYFQNVSRLPLNMYIWLIPLGLFVGSFGVLANRGTLLSQTLFNRLPRKLRPVLALFICLPCGIFLPQVMGGGRNLITIVQQTGCSLLPVFILLIVKLVFSCASFGSGAPGGMFMPIISIGALSGTVFGLMAAQLGVPSKYLPVFVVCAMAGGLSSCVKSPVTSIILTIELTGSVVYMLPVAICSFIALFLSDLTNTKPVYEALLLRYVEKNGGSLPKQTESGIREFPVEFGCAAAGKKICDISWPQGVLIVALRRGTRELVPQGNTVIAPGDYLVALFSEEHTADSREKIRALCRDEK